MKKRTLTFRLIALFLCFSLVFSGINPITIHAEDDPSDLGEYTTAAQNGRSVIFKFTKPTGMVYCPGYFDKSRPDNSIRSKRLQSSAC